MVNPVNTPSKSAITPQAFGQIAGYQLITKERTQQLELINHLVTNLANGIVVCGPEGIGKTKLLSCFKESKTESFIYCPLKGDSKLSLENIQELLSETLGRAIPGINLPSLTNAFDKLARRDSKVILIIDDAGSLAPGLIENIITYAHDKPVLRVVFALTHNELYLKTATDFAIDDCYHIDIPTLTEQQCGEFLEYLSTLPNPRIQYSGISENFTAELYRETHGIPGNILAQLPEANTKKIDYSRTILMSAVAGLVIVALAVQWWSSRPKADHEKNALVEHKQASALAQPAAPAEAKAADPTAITETPDSVSVIANPAPDKAANIPEATPNNVAQATVSSPAATDEKPASQEKNQALATNPESSQASAESHWLMDQPADNYTLQLMALSKQEPILDILQRYQGLGQNLRVVKTKTRTGKDRFILLYGSFSTPEQAYLEKQSLPKELKKTWLRKISSVQSEMNAAVATDAPASSTDTPEL